MSFHATAAVGSKRVDDQLQRAIRALLEDRPIAYHAVLAKALGSVTAGILLSQLLYWAPRASDGEGWFYKTREDIYEETGLGRREQETARKVLRRAGVIVEHLRGVPARIHFRIDMTKLTELLGSFQDEKRGSDGEGGAAPPDSDEPLTGADPSLSQDSASWADSAQLVGAGPPNQQAGNRPTISETTTETTSAVNGIREKFMEEGRASSKGWRSIGSILQRGTTSSEGISRREWLAEEILKVTGDRHSHGCYLTIAERCPPNLVFEALALLKEAGRDGRIRTRRGALFIGILRRMCRERGLPNPLPMERTPGKAASSARVAPPGRLVPSAPG